MRPKASASRLHGRTQVKPTWGQIGFAGLIAGGPTFLGTGRSVTSSPHRRCSVVLPDDRRRRARVRRRRAVERAQTQRAHDQLDVDARRRFRHRVRDRSVSGHERRLTPRDPAEPRRRRTNRSVSRLLYGAEHMPRRPTMTSLTVAAVAAAVFAASAAAAPAQEPDLSRAHGAGAGDRVRAQRAGRVVEGRPDCRSRVRPERAGCAVGRADVGGMGARGRAVLPRTRRWRRLVAPRRYASLPV